MVDKLGIAVCENYAQELRAIIDEWGFQDVVATSFPALCGKPSLTWDDFKGIIQDCEGCDRVEVLGQCCLVNLGAPPSSLARIQVNKLRLCFDMLLDSSVVDILVKEKAYLMTPGWLASSREIMREWGFDQVTAPEFFADFAKRLVLLDTGVDDKSAERLEEFASFTKLPFEIYPVGLSHFRLFLMKLILEWRLELKKTNVDAALGNAQKKTANYAMALDLLNSLVRSTSEVDVARGIIDLFTMLFAPKRVRYIAVEDGKSKVIDGVPIENNAAQKRLMEFSRERSWLETGNGFQIRIDYLDKTLGILEAEELVYPAYKEHYLNLALSITHVCGLAIENARKYERIFQTKKKLRSSNELLEEQKYELVRNRDELDLRVKERTVELREANERLEHELEERVRTEKALQESESKYVDLYENAPDMYVSVDAKTALVKQCNQTLSDKLGVPRGEIVGAPIFSLYHPDCMKEVEKQIQKFVKTGEIIDAELQLQKRDGSKLDVSLNVSAVRDADGNILASRSTWRDITQRKEAEEQVEQQLLRVQALHTIDKAITGSFSLESILGVVLETIVSQLEVDAVAVLLHNEYSLTLEFASGLGFFTTALQDTHLRLGDGNAGAAALNRKIVYIPDLSKAGDAFRNSRLMQEENFISYFGVPLLAKGKIMGVLEIFHRTKLDPDQDWLGFLKTLATQTAIAVDNASLFDEMQRSNVELALAYDTTLEGWARALELRDMETEGHSQRVVKNVLRLSRALGVSDSEIAHIRRGALLHDIGKMGIPDKILLKLGKLSAEEWVIMREHPAYAYEMLSSISFLSLALDIPYCHHEKWDGTGYPRGLKGEKIPLAARIFTVVDVWDALNSDRSYRKAWPREKIIKYMHEESGKSFEPRIVDMFFELIDLD
ncbi:MAG: PAS domain S-box protein [Chloroflexi bacterium]|nr:PAS domain S-box protein [Chloroflexota bacterium]